MRLLLSAATLLLLGTAPAFAQSHQPVQGDTLSDIVLEHPDAYPEYPGGVEGIVKFQDSRSTELAQ
ncbi:MAG: hypothetical protein K2K79_00935 [Paramuribaculum sp.]|nr:hypothetical protein [Paramuribaculum sp.]